MRLKLKTEATQITNFGRPDIPICNEHWVHSRFPSKIL